MTRINEEAPTNVIGRLLEVNQEISDSLSGARSYLLSKFKPPTNSGGTAIGGGWSQFLNEQDEPPSVTGTAHGIISLKACGEQMHSEVVSLGRHFIAKNARTDSGWTKPNLYNYCSLTRISSLALRALIDAGESFTEKSIEDSISWLLKAQNDDGGWGNMARDGKSDVTSTSYAIQVLVYIPGMREREREAIDRGRDWLFSGQNQDYSWGQTAGTRGTIAHTSEAVEALLASGVDRSELKPVQDWLISHINEDAQIIERYLIEIPQIEGTLSTIWTQVSRERALIALLKLGTSLTAPEVFNSVKKILNRQVNHTYWRSETHPDSEPIWALKEAVISLRLYQSILKSNLAAITLSEETSNLRDDVKELSARILRLESHIAGMSLKSRIVRASKLLRRPAVLVAAVTILLTGLYLYLRSSLPLPEYSDILMGIIAILGFGFSIYQIICLARKSSDKK